MERRTLRFGRRQVDAKAALQTALAAIGAAIVAPVAMVLSWLLLYPKSQFPSVVGYSDATQVSYVAAGKPLPGIDASGVSNWSGRWQGLLPEALHYQPANYTEWWVTHIVGAVLAAGLFILVVRDAIAEINYEKALREKTRS
jgi:hypothetical protein